MRKKRLASAPKGGRPFSLLTEQLRLLQPGQSITVTKEVSQLPVETASPLVQRVRLYASRRQGCKFSCESFYAVTSQGNVIVGCIVTLISTENEPEPARKAPRFSSRES